ADAIGVLDHQEPIDQRVARVWLVERREDPHAGRFAGTVGTDIAKHFARLYLERNIVHRVRIAKPAMHVAKFDLRNGLHGMNGAVVICYQDPMTMCTLESSTASSSS